MIPTPESPPVKQAQVKKAGLTDAQVRMINTAVEKAGMRKFKLPGNDTVWIGY